MRIATLIILALMVILILYGAAQLTFILIILTIIYICVCAVWINIKVWAKKYDS